MFQAPDDEVNSRLSAAVRRHSPMPLHHQIKVAVLEGVGQGWLEPGAQLPRERELAQTLGVSLAPVRQAMADVTREGYVDRIGGRGSFVRDRKLVEKIQILGSFHQSVSRHGLNVDVKVLTSDVTRPPHVVDAALTLRGRDAWCLRRFASIDGDPPERRTAWLPPRNPPGVSDQDLGPGPSNGRLGRTHGGGMPRRAIFVRAARPGLEPPSL